MIGTPNPQGLHFNHRTFAHKCWFVCQGTDGFIVMREKKLEEKRVFWSKSLSPCGASHTVDVSCYVVTS